MNSFIEYREQKSRYELVDVNTGKKQNKQVDLTSFEAGEINFAFAANNKAVRYKKIKGR